jgi:hypothetical protein
MALALRSAMPSIALMPCSFACTNVCGSLGMGETLNRGAPCVFWACSVGLVSKDS